MVTTLATVLLGANFVARLTAAPAVPAFDHVFVVVMENHSYNEIVGNSSAPYISALASANGLATNYKAVAHPSLPNYLALAGGSTFGITTDCSPSSCPVDAPNLVDRLESAGKTWKAYMESMPSPCYTGATSGTYAAKHNPFIYFNDVRTNPVRCAQDVPYTALSADLLTAATTPNFSWITPNLCSDMHDCSVATGDKWLQTNLPKIFASPAWTTQRSTLFLTWDEDDGSASNHVPMIVVSSGGATPAGTVSSSTYNHYSWLKTVETAWGMPSLGSNDT
ncbi:MAG TPA: alkaline phosphatase family protein, partial [Gemmataceae bacterium]|nr:alkaline phosphatase family protein [Gemmataceae bacterium]